MHFAIKFLPKEYSVIEREPIEDIFVKPSENMLEWYFVFQGSKDTPYEGGLYAGKIVFPEDYPFKAPSFFMLSESGRFEIGKKICYHLDEWNPVWSVRKLLINFVAFMNTNHYTEGSIETSNNEKIAIANNSKQHIFEIPIIPLLFSKEELGI